MQVPQEAILIILCRRRLEVPYLHSQTLCVDTIPLTPAIAAAVTSAVQRTQQASNVTSLGTFVIGACILLGDLTAAPYQGRSDVIFAKYQAMFRSHPNDLAIEEAYNPPVKLAVDHVARRDHRPQ